MIQQSFYWNGNPELTLEATKEALKATEQRLKFEKDDSVEDAHRADAKKGKGPPKKCDHCGKLGHIRIYCWSWLDDTDEGQEWERTHPEQRRKPKSKSETSKPVPKLKSRSTTRLPPRAIPVLPTSVAEAKALPGRPMKRTLTMVPVRMRGGWPWI